MRWFGRAGVLGAGGAALACLTAFWLSSMGTVERPAVGAGSAHDVVRTATAHGGPADRAGAPPGARRAGSGPLAWPTPGGAGRVAPTASPKPSAPPPAYPPTYRVGTVLHLAEQPSHYCTGSVVDSPHRDLVITAAHCVHGGAGGSYLTGLGFAPGVGEDGTEPAGVWRVSSAFVAPSWVWETDPDADVAFLVIEPLHGREIEDVVGGNPVAFGRGPGPVRLTGYPRDVDTPVVCDGTATAPAPDRLRVYCPGFSGGTSGSPWLAGARADGSGSVVGVVGGYLGGGTVPYLSYSSVFGQQVRDLYQEAVADS
ncbi:serine protease [Streptomyces sp. PTM05]|uniref:Serine protease n=1 Tax=Streptantibioticus parmotrematis TaxID=2873249 RepID=A0ABS7R2S6_9ACTN|nr:trypsin-like peptidase domain-containing protein [Streptantibioticus parmotrematis]MBY8888332.1 serine protease [Streptantibioticus parmotrematis]